MQILGLNKTTLLDYPGHIAATIFLGGCNFCCPFCHNKDLVFPKNALENGAVSIIKQSTVFDFLAKRVNILDGVCITGGEPTLNKELSKFITDIKNLGLKVKLDTNGSNPEMLKYLVNEHLIDYCAMDIKNSPDKYLSTCGIKSAASSKLFDKIKESVDFLLAQNNFPYEFRTTIVRELHDESDIIDISKWISGASAYFLQSYEESNGVIEKIFSAHSHDTLLRFQQICMTKIPNTQLRI